MADSNRYSKLASNTLLFAISNFSSKLLSLIIQPYLTYALQDTAVVGVTKLTSQCANLLIPLVSLGVSFAVIRFGLDKNVNKRQVFTNGLATIGCGFAVLLCLLPFMRRVPSVSQYLVLLYAYVLVSCLRTLCTQFIRSRQMNRLVALDGILCTFATLMFYVLFLNVLHLGAVGYLLAIICGDGVSTLFVFFAGKLLPYLDFKQFNKKLWGEMLRYCLPMIPAQISFWVINASDLFFVNGMCDGLDGLSGASWSGLLSTGYFLPTLVNTVGQIFYEAWQLSAVTEESERETFFSRIFFVYSSVMFCCASGIIWLCRPLMHIFRYNFYDAWQFIPFLTLAAVFTCFNMFLNSIYVVYKRSNLSLYTMMAGAIVNCFLNYFLIRGFGPNGATVASFLSLLLVFLLRAYSSRGLLQVDFGNLRVAVNLGLLVLQALLMLFRVPLYAVWCTLLTAAVIAYNFKGVWSMAGLLLGRFFPRLFKKNE